MLISTLRVQLKEVQSIDTVVHFKHGPERGSDFVYVVLPLGI